MIAKQRIPHEIKKSLKVFQKDHSSLSKTAFIIMSFSNSEAHTQIEKAIRETLLRFGVMGLRADDKEYHRDLYFNMLTYVYGCHFGVAVFDSIQSESFNPNVAFEVGYMFGIGKDVCLLKDKTIRVLHADLIGKLYKPFDPSQVAVTLPPVLSKWLSDKEYSLVEAKYNKLEKLSKSLSEIIDAYELLNLLFLSKKPDTKQYTDLITKARAICEEASAYDSPCPPQCLTVHTEADADPITFKKVNAECQHNLQYIARKRLTPNQPTREDNPLEAEVWGEYATRNFNALKDAQTRIRELMEDLKPKN